MIEIQTFINEQRFSRFQWLIFAMCFAIVLFDGFDTAAIGFIAPSLMTEWHIDRPALAPVLSAALLGLAFGAVLAGPVSDRLGRRVPLIASVLIFGLACLGSAYATNLTQFTALRFVTGIGLGAALPNAVTMMSEFSQDRWRATVTNLMSCGFPLGASFGGFLAAWLIPHFGWRGVLVVGGGAPLLLSIVLLATFPESVRYMVARRHPVERIRATLARIAASAADAKSFIMTEEAPAVSGKGGIQVVLSREYIVGSLMLWLAFFMGLVIIYGSINWLTVLLKDAGLPPQRATLVSALFPLGGVGAVLCGMLMDRFNPNSRHRGLLCIDRGQRLLRRAGGRQPWAAGADRVRRGRAGEHRAIVDARPGGRLLPDAGTRHRRRLDVRHRSLGRHRRIVSGCRADAGAVHVRRHLCGGGDRRRRCVVSRCS